MIEPATGAPTRVEAAAAIEEMRQRRHEKLSAGPGLVHDELMSGKVVLPGRTDQKVTPESETHSMGRVRGG
ncbi:hypothetical protein [Paenarthrobacter sp. AMU7]|uniref:Uncharacterized protein n=1 Tax=Paenarthrobacter sp. AMU7 TaxID=3162492 RepID=A0AB39YS39_9MICC